MKTTSGAVILARVSSKSQEDEGYSLDSQLKLLQGYCQNKELLVVKVFKITETASKQQSRKVFQELLDFITKNGVYHLAVEKTDRLTRNLRDAVAIDDWLEADGKRMLHAVKENMQLHKESKSDVKFMWNIHLAVAKKYTDNLREEAMKGWAEKLAQGWLPSVPPIGYVTITDHGKRIHIPDEKTMHSVQRAFKLYVQPSHSIATICEEMKAMGLASSKGKPFSKSHTQRILKNPFYIGINRFNGQDYPGAQEPIISDEIFKAVQTKMSSGRPFHYIKHNPVFKNMMSCEECGKVITWQKQKGRYYGSCQRDLEACRKRKFLREDAVNKMVEEKLEKLVCPSPDVMNWIMDLIESNHTTVTDNHEEMEQALRTRITRIEKMDEILYDDKLSGEITQERYQEKHQQFVDQIAQLKLKIAGVDEKAEARHKEGISIIKLTQEASSVYEEQEVEDKRFVITKLFQKITVEKEFVSVKYTKLSNAIAAKSEESRRVMQSLKFSNQTFQKGVNNGSEHKEKELEIALRSIWLGLLDAFQEERESLQLAYVNIIVVK